MNFFETYIHPKAYKHVGDVLNSGKLSEGVEVALFEDALKKRFRFKTATAVNSGTSALHLLLKAYNVGADDEVIISNQTFIATGLAVLYVGAKPVFADIDKYTGNITAKTLLRQITPQTKAVLLTHWGGLPCDLDEIKKLCWMYGILLFEDAAHALGAKYKNKFIGEYETDGTIFSFQAIKHLTTGDGGLVVVPEKIERRVKNLRWFGIDRELDVADETGERKYNLNEVGYKYHLNDFSAALGRANLLGMEYILNERKRIVKIYDSELKSVWGVSLLKKADDRESANWLYDILVENRIGFMRKLRESGIPVSVVHVGIDRNNIFGGIRGLPNQGEWDKHHVCLPLHHRLTFDDLELICKTIKAGW